MFCDDDEEDVRDCIQKQYSAAIRRVQENQVWKRCVGGKSGSQHDVTRAMHFAILLRGRRPIGHVFTNAMNVGDSSRGPQWTRAADSLNDRSIHAEARAAHRAFVPSHIRSRHEKRKASRSSIGTADGILVCRISDLGKLRFSLPCENCVKVLARCKFRFVVYSTGDPERPWHKISLEMLQVDNRVLPSSRLRRRKLKTESESLR